MKIALSPDMEALRSAELAIARSNITLAATKDIKEIAAYIARSSRISVGQKDSYLTWTISSRELLVSQA